MRRQHLLLIFLSAAMLQVSAQQKVLKQEELFSIVRKFHPVAKQAQLTIAYAKAEALSARGAFDPTVETHHSRKELHGLLYYNRASYELRIPT